MLLNNCDASQTAFSVGYENMTQFTREYRRLFGAPPRKNIMDFLNTSFGGKILIF